MISKELLSEVLDCNIDYFYIEENILKYDNSYENFEINIYELAHKCKGWAYNDKSLCGYSIELKSYKSEIGYWLCELMSEDITFSGDTEPEAIFKACQWILENKN